MSTHRTPGEDAAPASTWLDPDARCEVCLQVYSWELEVRCSDCDRPLCPFCAVWTERSTVWCTGCGGGDCGEDG